eukprot:2393483-Lingulodinium_polyedra.AAC.1
MAKPGMRGKLRTMEKGASMVIEMQAKNGQWLSFVADRLPSQLDDAIKRAKAEENSQWPSPRRTWSRASLALQNTRWMSGKRPVPQ